MQSFWKSIALLKHVDFRDIPGLCKNCPYFDAKIDTIDYDCYDDCYEGSEARDTLIRCEHLVTCQRALDYATRKEE